MSWITGRRVGAVLAAGAVLVALSGCGNNGSGSAAPAAKKTRPEAKAAGKPAAKPKAKTHARATAAVVKRSTATTTATTTSASAKKAAPASTTTTTSTTTSSKRPAPKKRNFEPRLRVEASRYDPVRSSFLTVEITQRADERLLSRASVVVPNGYGVDRVKTGRRYASASVNLVEPGQRSLLPPLVLNGDLKTVKVPGNSGCASNVINVLKGVLKPDAKSKQKTQVTLTVYVHKVGNSRRFTICMPSTVKLPGTPTIRRISLKIFSGLVPPGPGDAVWRGLFTPSGLSGDTAKKATTESQGIVPLPSFLTLEAAGKKVVQPGARIHMRGVLSLNGPAPRRKVRISVATDRRGFLSVGTARTGSNGNFTFHTRVQRTNGLMFFEARALSHDVPCMDGSSEAPAGCTSATVSGMTSAPLRITVKS